MNFATTQWGAKEKHPCPNSSQELPVYKPENLPLKETWPVPEENFKMEVSERGFEDLKWITQLRNKVQWRILIFEVSIPLDIVLND